MQELVIYITRSLVDNPDSVEVRQREGLRATILQLRLHPDDMGKVIGREGRVAKAIRALLNVTANRQRRRVILEIG